jgi:hypothetical protein
LPRYRAFREAGRPWRVIPFHLLDCESQRV